MTAEVEQLWPELEWISDISLRDKTARTWEAALGKSALKAPDPDRISFTLLCGPELRVSFIAHKRCVVHITRESGQLMKQFFGDELPVDMDVLIAGPILADVDKILEYELDTEGNAVQEKYSLFLRHPFSGVSLAEECRVPPEVCQIIASHAHEGDLLKRTTEAYIVHHADFMAILPFNSRLVI